MNSASNYDAEGNERTKVVCPHCEKTITVTKKGLVRSHGKKRADRRVCIGSSRPSDMMEAQ